MSASEGPVRLARLLSGGQTGVDRAALDAALSLGVACGGWCPRGRMAEDGPLPARYPLRETRSARPEQRTRWNVRDAEATLVLAAGLPGGGTALAAAEARRLGRPLLCCAPEPREASRIVAWLASRRIRVLNVAGPRESEAPGIYASTLPLLREVLARAMRPGGGPEGNPHPIGTMA